MMVVFIVSKHYDYEGSNVIAVYSTQFQAEQEVKWLYKYKSSACVHYDFDMYEVRE